jgi:CDP-diacylglycerol--serine O-phosphatidyltransferase
VKALPALENVNLANAITSLSLVAAAVALLLAAHGELAWALCAGALTLPCDVLDGVVARRRKTASDFGAQLDSLCDALAFGALPALLGHSLGVRGPWSVVLVLYPLGAVWRLARFAQVKLTTDARGRECFEGVPTTFSGAVFYVVAAASLWLPGNAALALLVGFYVGASVCMNLAFAFPKRGLHTRALWVLVPAALLASLAHG